MSISPLTFLNSLLLASQVFLGALLMASGLPLRGRLGLRVATGVSLLALWTIAYSACATAAAAQGGSPLLSIVLFGSVLFAVSLVISVLFDVSGWTALCCGTTGYAIQNLWSSLDNVFFSFLYGTSRKHSLGGVHFIELVVTMAVVYLACYLLFVRKVRRHQLSGVQDKSLLFIFAGTIIAILGFSVLIGRLEGGGVDPATIRALRTINAFNCVFLLFAEYEMLFKKHLETEAELATRLSAERGRQYEANLKSLEAINIRLHDIRHHISLVGARGEAERQTLDEIAQDVALLGCSVYTGNPTLDTILTEKGLACEQLGIELTCLVDGRSLDHLGKKDLCSLFGNALDNAIEATREVEPAEERRIVVTARRQHDLTLVHVENRFQGSRRFEDGLPVTTKKDQVSHGFGVKSMRHVVEKYGGTLTVRAQEGAFHVNALIPARREAPDDRS